MKALQGSPYMMSRTALILFLVSLYLPFQCAEEQLEVFIRPSDKWDFVKFSGKVKEKNPSIKTHLTIWGKGSDTLTSVVSNYCSSSFARSSQNVARAYGFDGLNLYWDFPGTEKEMDGMASLLQEWCPHVDAHDRELMLAATVAYSPHWPYNESVYPIDSMARYLNLKSFSYIVDRRTDFPATDSALYDPSSNYSTDYGINKWIHGGLMPSNVLGLAFFGYAWNLTDPENKAIAVPGTGPAQTKHGLGMVTYKEIKYQSPSCAGIILYNDTHKIYSSYSWESTWTGLVRTKLWISDRQPKNKKTWTGFEGDETIKTAFLYSKGKMLRSYIRWPVSDDEKWLLPGAAEGQDDKAKQEYHTSRLLKVLLALAIVSVLLLLGFLVYILKTRMIKLKASQEPAEDLNGNAPDFKVFSFSDIEKATNRFSNENKIGEGGFGVVYKNILSLKVRLLQIKHLDDYTSIQKKGILPDGEKIAVKRRSKGSTQGFIEFKNETTLNPRLQHVNLVRLFGFCKDREEQMLVYEYMPNKSLDFYLSDPTKQHLLNWKQLVCIIEGVTQGLIYLQEYSRLTIIHRDLKARNILLDHEMKPKISDFGMAKPFRKDEPEERASKLVGTYGYIPPEYVEKGLCSIKSDVYSFGIIHLQIISGKRISCLYGENNDLNLLEYAYVLWKEGKGMEFMDSSLDDTSSPCKLMRCLEIALLCVQKNAEDRPCMLEVARLNAKKQKQLHSNPKTASIFKGRK